MRWEDDTTTTSLHRSSLNIWTFRGWLPRWSAPPLSHVQWRSCLLLQPPGIYDPIVTFRWIPFLFQRMVYMKPSPQPEAFLYPAIGPSFDLTIASYLQRSDYPLISCDPFPLFYYQPRRSDPLWLPIRSASIWFLFDAKRFLVDDQILSFLTTQQSDSPLIH